MKRFIRHSLLNSFTLYLSGIIFPSLIVPNQLGQLLITGAVFTLINLLVKPIIKLFLLPINLVSLGLFRWVSNVLVLWLLTRFTPQLKVVAFTLPAVNTGGFAIPSLTINLFLAYILTSFGLSLIFSALDRFMVKD